MPRYLSPALIAAAFLMSLLAACGLPGRSASPEQSVPAATPTATPQLSACSNPLLPVSVGAEWKYALSGITAGSFTRTITAVGEAGFTERDVFDTGLTRIAEWKCENGALTSLSPAEGLTGMIQAAGIPADFETTASNGVTLPASIRPNDSWTQNFTMQGVQAEDGQDAQTRGDVSSVCTAAASETVVVAAGAFDAMRVGCQINATVYVSVLGIEVPTELASVTTIWYARGVGMVKTENEVSGLGHSTVELTSFTIP